MRLTVRGVAPVMRSARMDTLRVESTRTVNVAVCEPAMFVAVNLYVVVLVGATVVPEIAATLPNVSSVIVEAL